MKDFEVSSMLELTDYIFITAYASSLILLVMILIRRRKTKNKMNVIQYETDKIGKEVLKLILIQILALSLISWNNKDPVGLIEFFYLGLIVNQLVMDGIYYFDKPKIYNNGLYCITGKISWEDIVNYEWEKSNYSNHYNLIFITKPSMIGKLLFVKKRLDIQFVFHKNKVKKVDNYISKKTN